MANWKSFNPGKDEYKVDWDANKLYGYSSLGGVIYLNIEFDADRTTPVSTVCRFKITCAKDTQNSWNLYYVAIDPENETGALNRKGGTLYQLKDTWTEYDSKNKPYPFFSNKLEMNLNSTHKGEFTLYKKYNETNFSMPAIYIYNEGQGNGNGIVRDYAGKYLGNFYLKKLDTWAETYRYHYTDSAGYRWLYNDALVAKFPAKNLTTKSDDFDNDYKATDVGTGEVSITDNGDNSFTITAIPGTNGKNNKVNSATLTYYKNGTKYTNDCTGGAIEVVETIPSSYERSLATFPVSASVATEGTYGNSTIDECAASIVHYRAPDKPGVPVIRYEKHRLTTKENWRYSWEDAQWANVNSPVVGYRISIFKNTAPLTKLGIYRGPYNNDSQIILDSNNPYTYVDFDHCPCNIYFNPKELGFEAKDSVRINIRAYAINGKGTKLFGESASSETLVVQNAGVIRVKVNGGWKEGQVYVKISGHWKEAETVQTKVNGKWRESE